MDNELKLALEAMEKRITARFEQVDGRFGQIDNRFAQIDSHFAQVDKHFEEVFEHIHNTETKLLNGFYGWAKPVESRLKVMPSIDERLGFMEERITAVERRLLERDL